MPQSLPSVDNGSHYSSTAISFFPSIFLVGSLSFFYVLFWPHLSNRVKAQYKKNMVRNSTLCARHRVSTGKEKDPLLVQPCYYFCLKDKKLLPDLKLLPDTQNLTFCYDTARLNALALGSEKLISTQLHPLPAKNVYSDPLQTHLQICKTPVEPQLRQRGGSTTGFNCHSHTR